MDLRILLHKGESYERIISRVTGLKFIQSVAMPDKVRGSEKLWSVHHYGEYKFIFDSIILDFANTRRYPEKCISLLIRSSGYRGYISASFGHWGNWSINEYKALFNEYSRRFIDRDTDELVVVNYGKGYNLYRMNMITLTDTLWSRVI